MRWFSACALAAVAALPGQLPGQQAGHWRAELASPGGALQFDLELRQAGDGWAAAIRNGEEVIEVPTVRLDDGELLLGFDHYDSTVRARLSDGVLRGTWRKRRGGERWTEMEFAARRRDVAEAAADTTEPGPRLADRWAVQFERDRQPSVGQFEVAANGAARGTFLTTLGDYRFLAGTYRGGQLTLSCFDGAHAFLFRATHQDGRLRGDFWSSDSWHETWTAQPDADAALPDAWQLTEWRGDAQLGGLAFPDLDGRLRRLDEPALRGRAQVLVVFGSWCPN